MHPFQIVGIEHAPFVALFQLSDVQLLDQGAVRCVATESPGFPCRISLEDAQIGEELLLLAFTHQAGASPYRASGPIFVRRGVQRRTLAVGEVPAYVTDRLISVRAYSAAHFMVAASVCEGANMAQELGQYFDRTDVAYVHLHNAKRGCFSCLVNRAELS
jgi:hypothetical protein